MSTYRVSTGSYKKNLLVDAGNLFNRTMWAVSVRENINEGPVSLSGFMRQSLSFIGSWIHEIRNVDNVMIFMDGYPKRRKEAFPEYKQKPYRNRSCTFPEGPFPSFSTYSCDDLRSFLSCFFRTLNCDVYYDPREEADDLIHSFVKENSSDINIIASSDKDFFQLIGGSTVLYRVGAESPRLVDSTGVHEAMNKLYKVEIAPSSIRMFKALTGDPSDGIKGVTRLRKKSAASICTASNPDELLQSDLSALSKKEKETLTQEMDRVRLNWGLVGMFDIDMDNVRFQASPDFTEAKSVLASFGLPHDLCYPFRLNSVSKPSNDDFLSDI